MPYRQLTYKETTSISLCRVNNKHCAIQAHHFPKSPCLQYCLWNDVKNKRLEIIWRSPHRQYEAIPRMQKGLWEPPKKAIIRTWPSVSQANIKFQGTAPLTGLPKSQLLPVLGQGWCRAVMTCISTNPVKKQHLSNP